MSSPWTLAELVSQVGERIAALPAPKNGQVRAVPDERTVRYYGTIGLLDRPLAMRGRTALYGPRHLAQVVAIKRLQSSGKSLAEIQDLWPTLDDATLSRISGVTMPRAGSRYGFWKQELAPTPATSPAPSSHVERTTQAGSRSAPPSTTTLTAAAPVELRLQLAPNVFITVAVEDSSALALTPADVRAIRAAAAPLVTELASRQLTQHAGEEDL